MAPDDWRACQLVNPFIGTAGQGHVFPGAAWPFGMVQPSPDTPGGGPGGGYEYADDRLTGFSTLHLSGPGCPAFGHVTLMPAAMPVAPGIEPVRFSHARERARAGAYQVVLDEVGLVEVTAGPRTAWYRLTPTVSQPALLVDLDRGQSSTTAATLSLTGPHTLEVSQTNTAFGGVRQDPSITVHAVLTFSRPVQRLAPWDDGHWCEPEVSLVGVHLGAAIGFEPADEPLVVAVTVSLVDADGARGNSAAEFAAVGLGPEEHPSPAAFDLARARARDAWDAELGRVEVTGADERDLRIHHTALYHALLAPTLASDHDGRYLGADRRVHRVVGRNHYTNFSLWDTFRTQQPLLALGWPRRAREMALSLAETALELGTIPRWVLGGVETNLMSGDSGTQAIAQAVAFGSLTDAEAGRLFPLLVDHARRMPPPGSPGVGRHGVAFYREHGYVAWEPEDPHSCGSASCGLEWSAADAALALLAVRLGRRNDADDLRRQSARYPSGYDPSTGFFRPRHADGSWMEPFDPAHVTALWIDRRGYEEGSAWQYLAGVPHDPEGWAELLGGRERALARLDDLFAIDQVRRDPTCARALWRQGAHYAAWNEHDMQAPWTYAALGLPERTDLVVATDLDQFFGDGPDGLPDNDDLGTLSAWYLLGAWGLYHYAPGTDEWLLHRPRFDEVCIRPDDGSAPTIVRRSGGAMEVDDVTINGRPAHRGWLHHDELRGVEVVFHTRPGAPPRSATPPPGVLTQLARELG